MIDDLAPILRPEVTLPTMNWGTDNAEVCTTMPKKYRAQPTKMPCFLPYRSAVTPPMIDPIIAPAYMAMVKYSSSLAVISVLREPPRLVRTDAMMPVS